MVWAKCKLKRIDYTLLEENIIKVNNIEDYPKKVYLRVTVRLSSAKI